MGIFFSAGRRIKFKLAEEHSSSSTYEREVTMDDEREDEITLTKSQAEEIWFFLREYYWKWSKDREHD